MSDFIYEDESQIWLKHVLAEHYEEALARANSLIEDAVADENGCLVTATAAKI